MAKDEFVFLPLGGSGEIGMNMNLYGFGPAHDRQWIMIDCGVMFADARLPGIELICPDPAYIVEHRDRLLGLLLTHGHEDHIGAVALLAPQLGCPIYATAFTAALVRRKLAEQGLSGTDLNVIERGAHLSLGPFDLEYVTLTHSIPEPNGVVVRTPLGVALHTGDWKIDPTPALGPMTDSAAIRALGDEGLLAMICDSTNVLTEGESGSETDVRNSLIKLVGEQTQRVAVASFASNVSRVVSICEAAAANGRSVCLLGRSMIRIVDVAREIGLLPEKLVFVEPAEARALPRRNVLYLCTGSQGEPRAALARIARDDHPDIALADGDTVIFSSKIIPGNERDIYSLQNELIELGVKVITEKDEFIHVSGHPCRDELRKMYEWARPKIAVPVHGEARHLEEHADFALTLGAEEAIAPRNGDLIRLAPGAPEIIDEVPAGRLYLDGARLLPEGASPLRERRKLSFGGHVSISLVLNWNGEFEVPPAAILYGAPDRTEDGDDVALLIEEEAEVAVMHIGPKKRLDDEAVEIAVRRAVRNRMISSWGKRPIVSVVIHRIEQ